MQMTNNSIQSLLDSVEESRKSDMSTLVKLGETLTRHKAKLWGSIIGFGHVHYRYPSGQEGDMPILGIASRQQGLTLYASYDIGKYPDLSRLGKFRHGKGCLYIKKLSDVDLSVLTEILKKAMEDMLSLPFITVVNDISH